MSLPVDGYYFGVHMADVNEGTLASLVKIIESNTAAKDGELGEPGGTLYRYSYYLVFEDAPECYHGYVTRRGSLAQTAMEAHRAFREKTKKGAAS